MIEHGVAKQVEAFRLMWDAFPEPAMLIGDGRKVLAANALGRRLGITAGSRCGGLAPVEAPPVRNSMERLRDTQSALVEIAEANGEPVLSYWVPVAGARNLAVHFGIGVVSALEHCWNVQETCNKPQPPSSFPAGELPQKWPRNRPMPFR